MENHTKKRKVKVKQFMSFSFSSVEVGTGLQFVCGQLQLMFDKCTMMATTVGVVQRTRRK